MIIKMPRIDKKTFEEVGREAEGTIYYSVKRGRVQFFIMRGPFSLCVYFGVTLNHPLTFFTDYDKFPFNVIRVHGGFTFSEKGYGDKWPSDFWWWGWDYAHAWDATYLPLIAGITQGTEWTPQSVLLDSLKGLSQFYRFAWVAELCRKKTVVLRVFKVWEFFYSVPGKISFLYYKILKGGVDAYKKIRRTIQAATSGKNPFRR